MVAPIAPMIVLPIYVAPVAPMIVAPIYVAPIAVAHITVALIAVSVARFTVVMIAPWPFGARRRGSPLYVNSSAMFTPRAFLSRLLASSSGILAGIPPASRPSRSLLRSSRSCKSRPGCSAPDVGLRRSLRQLKHDVVTTRLPLPPARRQRYSCWYSYRSVFLPVFLSLVFLKKVFL